MMMKLIAIPPQAADGRWQVGLKLRDNLDAKREGRVEVGIDW